MRLALRLVSTASLACVSVGTAFGQTSQTDPAGPVPYLTGDPSTWPVESDAVVAAPNNHRILLENEHVRVLEVSIPPNTVEPLHSHRWRSTLYIQQAGDFIDRDANGNIVFDTRTLDAPLTYPLTMWKEPEAPHSVENLSSTITLRLVRVELKTP